jgi:hypothetical protein
MPKKKLTNKTKQEIRENPFRVRKSDYSGDALQYLNRVRGARKAKKTREEKAKYKAPRKKSEKAPAQVSDLIDVAAKAKGMSPKKFRKKYAKEVEKFERTGTLFYNREIDILKLDIKFMKGKYIHNQGRRTTKIKAIYWLTRLKNKIIETGLVYDRVNVEHYYDGKGNLFLEIPIPKEYVNLEGQNFLNWLKENYPTITFYSR